MIRALERVDSDDVLFIDIETVRAEKELTPDTPLHAAWAYKSRYQNEIDRKTGEKYTDEEYFKEKAALYAPFAKIVDISIGKIVEKEGQPTKIVLKSYFGDDENDLLTRFNTDLEAYSAKNSNLTLCGLNNIGFDEPFIFKRMLVNQIVPHKLLDSSGLKPWDVKSIDLGKLFQGSSFYPDSLVAICAALNIPSPKDGIDGSMVSEVYYNGGLTDIVKYCEKDVQATANVFLRMKFKSLIETVEVISPKEKEAPAPLLQRLYMSKNFKGVQPEFTALIEKVGSLTEDEKKHLVEIILSVYTEKNDRVAIKKEKKVEVEAYVYSL